MADAREEGVVIPTAVVRAHQLAWHPGRWMHPEWWSALDLTPWREVYHRHDASRRELDRLIIARRGFPREPLPAVFDAEDSALLALETKMPQLVTALGLIALDCRDYLLLGAYRRALAPVLGARGCDPLLAVWPRWGTARAAVPPEELAGTAVSVGAAWLSAAAPRPAWLALSIVLPPAADAPIRTDDVWSLLRRLARWL